MKKLILTTFLIFIGSMLFAQNSTSFGITAGYANVDFKTRTNGSSESKTDSGAYLGGFMDIAIDGGFHIQTEALLTLAHGKKFISLPILAKLYIADSKVYVMAGPQANILLHDDFITEGFGLDLTFGLGYDINEHFFIYARYSLELTDRLKNASSTNISEIGYNTLNVGIGYKF